MSNYFEKKLTYNPITFFISDNPTPTEREIHNYHEILYYVGGKADLLTEEGQRPLQQNSLLLIPKDTYHFFRSEHRFLRLKIRIPTDFLQATPFGRLFSRIAVLDEPDNAVAEAVARLYRIVESEDGERGAFRAYSAFLMLLCELDSAPVDRLSKAELAGNGYVSTLTSIIAQNLSGDLSIRTLAEQVGLSPSSVTHTFKKELGISLHEYVVQRRLMLAKEKIATGYKPTEIFADCGFQDYSSFYKAYCRFFGYPPSKEQK
ncbi:MAG: helix-turn-helix transcriptional regulator [Clostridia bacterium]|nr:helix-turn-helix transcriptional regulator [Clostridia bacterium]